MYGDMRHVLKVNDTHLTRKEPAAMSHSPGISAPVVSVIIPYYAEPRLPHLRARLDDLCQQLSTVDGIEVVVSEAVRCIGDGTLGPSGGRLMPSIRHVEHVIDGDVFSIGATRNHGAQCATGTALAFCDVDLRLSTDSWRRLLRSLNAFGIGEFKKRFFSVPCLYLTERGTRQFESAASDMGSFELLLAWLHGRTDLVELLAPCTSFIVIDRLHFLAQGGYSHAFGGHGFEDFELHHRLISDGQLFIKPEDYYRDYNDWTAGEYRGFRAMFSLLGRGALYGHLLAVHLWHDRPVDLQFYEAKVANGRRLVEAMATFDGGGHRPAPLVAREAHNARFMFMGAPQSNAAATLRDVFPLLGTPVFVDEKDFIDAAESVNTRELEHMLAASQITRVLFRNPYRNAARLALYRWCRENHFPYIVFERGGLPNSWFFDSQGFNADSTSYRRELWDRALTSVEDEQVRKYISWCVAGHETLEPQGSRIGAQALAARLGVSGKKVLVVPLQRPSDTATVHMAGAAGSASEFLTFIDACAERLRKDDWVVLCKRHPYETSSPALRAATYVEPDTNILDLVALADRVAVINSSVGLYAMMTATPCYVFGDAYFAFDGVNEAVESLHVENVCARVRNGMVVDMDRVHRFIWHLVSEVYSFGRASYASWAETDAAFRKAATAIDFTEIRIPGVARRIYRDEDLSPVPFTAPLYADFQGSARRTATEDGRK
jgi:predicted glycosyltransferase involved in capsule biosynthesis